MTTHAEHRAHIEQHRPDGGPPRMTRSHQLAPDVSAAAAAWPDARAGRAPVDSCVLAAAVLCDLFPDRAVAHAASTVYANGIAQALIGKMHGRRLADMHPRAYTVGALIGAGPNDPSRYRGHVIVIVDGIWLVDLTAQQFDRPTQGIRVRGPVTIDLTTGDDSSMWHGIGKQWPVDQIASGGGVGWAHYTLDTERDDYTRSGDWRHPSRRSPLVAAMAAAIGTA